MILSESELSGHDNNLADAGAFVTIRLRTWQMIMAC